MNSALDRKIYSYSPNLPVLNLIPKKAKKLLDIGCGNGGLIDFYTGTIDGITISESEYEIAKKRLNNVFLHNLEQGLPEKLEKYDVVLASHVLEHIAYPDKLLSDVKKVMNAQSIFIVALPNIMHYKYRFKLFFGNFKYENTGVMDYTHLRWYTFHSAKKMLKKNGFEILEAFVDGELPFYRLTKFLPKKIQRITKKVLFLVSKGFFGMQLIYIVKK